MGGGSMPLVRLQARWRAALRMAWRGQMRNRPHSVARRQACEDEAQCCHHGNLCVGAMTWLVVFHLHCGLGLAPR